MNTTDISQTAHQLIDTLPISPMDSYILLSELLETCGKRGGLLRRARTCIRRGVETVKQEEKSVSFAHACASSLEARSHRRASTLREIRSVLLRMTRQCPDLKNKQVRTICTDDCRRWLDTCFSSPLQWNKGRVILSGVLSHAVRQNWSQQNAAQLLPRKFHKEQRIIPLSLREVTQLLESAQQLYEGTCLPACALMIFAGLRPQETRRLTWSQVNLKANIINILPDNSKTGGGRLVSILPVLRTLLLPHEGLHPGNSSVCPPAWATKWRDIRRQAGVCKQNTWVQDVLRHTYASYHLAHFGDRQLLQKEMGHRSEDLLNWCYINLQNITPSTARQFWSLHQRI